MTAATKTSKPRTPAKPSASAPAAAPAAPRIVKVLALRDLPDHGAKAGHLVEIDAKLLETLKTDGAIDTHPKAIAAAKAAAERR